jgi:hypothetical protein
MMPTKQKLHTQHQQKDIFSNTAALLLPDEYLTLKKGILPFFVVSRTYGMYFI